MMNEKKDISITTSAFSLTIHWNGPVIMTQLSVLAGMLLLWVITSNPNVHTLCLIIGLLDLASIVISLLIGSKVEVKDATGGNSPAASSTPKQQTVESKEAPAAKEEKVKSHKSTSTSNDTIKNKVPLPAQKGVTPVTPAPAPIQSNSEPLPPKDMPEPEVEKPAPKKVEEMNEDDLDELFNW